MDHTFARKLQVPLRPLTHKIPVHVLNGQELPTISFITEDVTLITSGNHTETISFYILDTPLAPIVLGHPWLTRHPKVDWQLKSVSAWSSHCHKSCLVSACPSVSVPVFQEEAVDLSNVPAEYLDLKEVFSKSRAASLPPHRPYDCAIELLPGTSPPKGKLYSLSAPEREAMEKYISDSLASGFIRPSSSPAGAGFFFVGKKDGSLRPCIDYRGLNSITVRNTYPLPLMSSAFERLQGASIFTKLDLPFFTRFWREFCKLLGATVSLSSGFHPQSNGQTERANQDLERTLRCVVSKNPSSWSQILARQWDLRAEQKKRAKRAKKESKVKES